MAVKRTKVWLSATTREALAQLAQKWAEEMSTDWAPGVDGMHVSAERVILELIRRDEAHRARARKQRILSRAEVLERDAEVLKKLGIDE